jgi:transcriptional regulator with XRE-family HTH domain/predicted RNase H-like HicB family nuclease
MTAREVVAVLKADGWLLVRLEGLAPDEARSGDGPDAPRRLADRHAQEHREAGRHQVAEVTMRYPAVVTKEGKNVLADFPTCPGCHTFAPPGRDIEHEAKEALELWLESHLQERMLPPRPPRTFKARKGTLLWVPVEPKLGVKLELRWMREDLGLTQAELAELAGVSQPAIAQLESPDSNPTINTLNRVARAMGAQIDFHPSAGESVKSYAKQLRRLVPGPARQRVIEAMRDHLSGRTSRQFRAPDAALRARR